MNPPLNKQLFAETLATFCLVFAGAGAIIINDLSGGAITHVGVAITFGLVVLVMIYTVGDISGAHLNPAVTIGFYVAGRFDRKWVLPFIACQCAGAVTASVVLRVLFPAHELLGATVPHGSALQSFILEIILSFILMFVILGVSVGAKEKGITAGIVIGSVIMLEAMFAGPISGASMNPARSLGPALISGHISSLWVYLAAPVIGAALSVPACRCVREAGCCRLADACR